MLDFRQPVCVQTNASFLGFGAVRSDDWFAGSWSKCLIFEFHNSCPHSAHCSHAGHAIDPSLRLNINYLELFPILIAVRPQWLNKRVIVKTDNTQAMAFTNNGMCRNPIAMSWLREIFLDKRSIKFSHPVTALTRQTEPTRRQIESTSVFRSQ